MWSTNEEILRSIPALSALPPAAIAVFRSVANRQLEKGDDESMALKIAWGVVKGKFKEEGGKWTARSGAFVETTFFTFDAQPAESFITRSADGSEVHNYVLSDIWPDGMGTAPTKELLDEWASWINRHQPEADVDHELFNQAIKMYGHDKDRVKKMMDNKKGIAKAVSAVAANGKLMVSLVFDKRYKNHIDSIKGLSIEASTVRDAGSDTSKMKELLGFTLAVGKSPVNPRARRIE